MKLISTRYSTTRGSIRRKTQQQQMLSKYYILFNRLFIHKIEYNKKLFANKILVQILSKLLPTLGIFFLSSLFPEAKIMVKPIYRPCAVSRNRLFLKSNPLSWGLIYRLKYTITFHEGNLSSLICKVSDLLKKEKISKKHIDIICSIITHTYLQYYYANKQWWDWGAFKILQAKAEPHNETSANFKMFRPQEYKGGNLYSGLLYPVLSGLIRHVLVNVLAGSLVSTDNVATLLPFSYNLHVFANAISPLVYLCVMLKSFFYIYLAIDFCSDTVGKSIAAIIGPMVKGYLSWPVMFTADLSKTVGLVVKISITLMFFRKDIVNIIPNTLTIANEINFGVLYNSFIDNLLDVVGSSKYMPSLLMKVFSIEPLLHIQRTKEDHLFYSLVEHNNFMNRVLSVLEMSLSWDIDWSKPLSIFRAPLNNRSYLDLTSNVVDEGYHYHYFACPYIPMQLWEPHYLSSCLTAVSKFLYFALSMMSAINQVITEYRATEQTYYAYKVWAPHQVMCLPYCCCYVVTTFLVDLVTLPIKIGYNSSINNFNTFESLAIKIPFMYIFQIFILYEYIRKNKSLEQINQNIYEYTFKAISLQYLVIPLVNNFSAVSSLNTKYTQYNLNLGFTSICLSKSPLTFDIGYSVIEKLVHNLIIYTHSQVKWINWNFLSKVL